MMSMRLATGSEFVVKLFQILEEPENYPYISWMPDGRSFVISDQQGFSEFVLEKHFRHKNWSSFVRQLNKYDFYKVRRDGERTGCIEAMWEYRNKHFQRGKHELLSKIRRKKAPSEGCGAGGTNPKQIESGIVYQSHVLDTVRSISKYLQTVVEDINEIKKYIYHERMRIALKTSVLFVREGVPGSEWVYGALKIPNYSLTVVEESADVGSIMRWRYDVVVLYANSPRCITAVSRIRDEDEEVPIVLVVDEGFKSEYANILGIRATEALLMPFDPSELVDAINRHGSQRSPEGVHG
ncbi:HEAT SHOCK TRANSCRIPTION FACTOR HSF [Encephalitozoon cuniculi GB-M1]|uniref:HEAT SHOCK TRANSCRIPTION FACTOR HSF n=1 Tax=Encephalitozoon cuniculi (strain GB-M1) TaxID=284813 RepID=Q8SRB4_ENCCU|nr:heat shock transcription factor [Encephalitozoon cuniculi GB-M1]CAD26403.1 HEAT SHOCK TRANSCRIPTION FACTOR HSF [Encephalitozoon cuniculi GB-M1]